MGFKKIKRPGWEYFVVGVLVASVMLLSLALYAKQDENCKARQLMWELQTLRNFVAAHLLEKRNFPQTLEEVPASKLDPFGKPYQYNSKTGWVSSTSPPYVYW